MGLLVNGIWRQQGDDTDSSDGEFIREDAAFRHWVTVDGRAGPTGDAGFAAVAERYHLYVSLACPWAHRALLLRSLKGLEGLVGVSVVHPHMLEHGWSLSADFPAATGDVLHGDRWLSEIYVRARPQYTGRVTVPVLWDQQSNTIVSNESADIVRMFNNAFEVAGARSGDFYPADLRPEIDAINADVYEHVNNGVYKAGFATSQRAYETAFDALFDALERLEQQLARQRFLLGATLTEADWRLFTTLVRFDAVYFGHFKCNLRRIADYPALSGYLRDLYQYPGVAATVDLAHIKAHYYFSHDTINPTRIVPRGPELALHAPHDRASLGAIEVRCAA